MAGIGIIGSGNTAWQLAHQLANARIEVNFIASRNSEKAKEIAASANIPFFALNHDLPTCSGIFLCVSDNAIEAISNHYPFKTNWLAHCSGSVSINALQGNYEKAVFYPLQTMTKGRLLPANKIPICIEVTNFQVLNELIELCQKCGFSHQKLNSEQRAKAHVSAVFVNNFVNHILRTASEIAQENGINQALFKELAEETLAKFFDLGGQKAQTGPAKRNDQKVIDLHKQMIATNADALILYTQLTESIKNKNGV